jgi:putative spermidine/putrescine transport system ATP-binding protein
MNATNPVLVNIRNLEKRYGDVAAVDGVTLDVRKGEFLTFLGSSGSGKTTTLFIVAGFEDPSRGDVLIDGKSVLSIPPHRRNIGMVFQRYTLFPHLSVFDNVAFPLSVRRRPKAEIEANVRSTLALVRLEAYADRKPGQLSGGQQQRVALARALVYKPRILLMDEPLGALDKKLREEIQAEIRRIHQETGVTILYVTHDQEEALRLSDRIAVFSHGRIEQIGTGIDLYEAPRTAFVGGFIGNSNFIVSTVRSATDERRIVELPDGSSAAACRGERVSAGRAASLMIRPEKMRLVRQADGSGDDSGVKVHVSEATYLGESLAYKVVTNWGQELHIRRPIGEDGGEWLPSGAEAYALWHSDDAHTFAS